MTNMAMLRSSTVMAGLIGIGSATPRSRKPVLIKNAPYTINTPHKGQAELRIAFGEAAKEAHNRGQININGLPGAAGYIEEQTFNVPDKIPKDKYPSRMRHTYHTLDELKDMIKGGVATE